MEIINIEMDEKLYKAFKTKVANDNTNMQDEIIEFITEYLKEQHKGTIGKWIK